MTTKRRVASIRRHAAACLAAACVVAALASPGCGGGAARDVEHAFKKGDYQEAVALARHAVRTGDDSPKIRAYYGLSLVGMGRDHEGFGEIDAAVEGDHDYAEVAARFLWKLGSEGAANDVAARRLRKAAELSPSIELGRYGFAVADVSFAERDYAEAAQLYEQAIRAFPDTSVCEEAFARLAECYREMGESERARETMEALVERYPRGLLADRATARLDDITFDEAQRAFDNADFEKAIELSRGLADNSENRSLQQQARFLLGQSYEATGDVASAYAAYRDIIGSDRGDSGRVVERARARIEALQEAGLQ